VSQAAPVETSRAASAPGAPGPRRFWLCADDYGMAPGVNRAIRDLIQRRRINATSVMVVAPSFSGEEAAALAAVAGERRAALGLHFTLTAPFRPATRGYRPLAADGAFLSLPALFAKGLTRRLDPDTLAAEAAGQLEAFRAAFGRAPDFVDGHQHVQLLPQVTDALVDAMRSAAPSAWMRQCGRAAWSWRQWSDVKGHFLGALSARLRARCAASGIRTNPGFSGTYDFDPAGGYEARFGAFLEGLPEGGVVMCHPGFVDAELVRLDPVTVAREQEHAFLAGDRFPELLAARNLALA
jgi:chitin disaccharide deacetylase